MRFGAATGLAAAAGVEAGGRLPLRADRVLPRRPPGLAGAGRGRRRSRSTPGSSWWPASAMARNLHHPGPDRPARRSWTGSERDRNAGVDAACDLVTGIRDSGAFDGRAPHPRGPLPRGGGAPRARLL